ncbi:MAG: hypothetical protein E6H08_04880 [Bacteroidetes bacterium]|nr:MAG: hypothetical protein E6H08_04880 [Bacteroidota bacterium]
MIRSSLCLLICLFQAVYAVSQLSQSDTIANKNSSADSISMAFSTKYEASPSKQFFWGKHYRKEWGTIIRFPVLDMKTFKGGLTPDKLGGGHQSKSLRVIAGDGKEYVLRTVNKDLTPLIPENLRGTYLHRQANDQLSMAHPYGAMIVAKLAETISVFHMSPEIVFVPSTEDLKEFRDTIGNQLCYFEERPSGKGWEKDAIADGADEVENSDKMLEKFAKDTKYRMDQKELLKARLLDMMINDFDRHEDNWNWAKFDKDSITLYKAFPKDRDQALSRVDGLFMHFIAMPWAVRPLENLTPKVKDVLGENFAARNLDRQFLNELTREDWQQTIAGMQSLLTNDAIKEAVDVVPDEVNKYSGDFLKERLIQRKDNLSQYGMRYYRKLNKYVSVVGSAKDEHFAINFLKDSMSVTGMDKKNDTFYHRIFYPSQTKEINIYGLESKDDFTISGNAKNKFKVRIIGGEENDNYIDNRSGPGKKIKVYDIQDTIDLSAKEYHISRIADTLYEYKRDRTKYDWFMPFIVPGYNPDDGVYFGIGFKYKKQKWGKAPFGWEQSIKLEATTQSGFVGFSYKGLFKHVFGRWDMDLIAIYRGPKFLFNYYGDGNETELIVKDKTYYRTGLKALSLNPGVIRETEHVYVRFSLEYDEVKVLKTPGKFISSAFAEVDPRIFSRQHFAGVRGDWSYSSVDVKKNPTRGINIEAGFNARDNLDKTSSHLNLNGSFSFYQSLGKSLVFAHRTGGATNIGDYDIYFANTLGRSENLRGFWRYRFSGKTSFYQNTELRLALSKRKNFGMLGFFDDGRVWIEDEDSKTIHVGYGGGLYFIPFNALALNLSYARSKETSMILIKTDFLF